MQLAALHKLGSMSIFSPRVWVPVFFVASALLLGFWLASKAQDKFTRAFRPTSMTTVQSYLANLSFAGVTPDCESNACAVGVFKLAAGNVHHIPVRWLAPKLITLQPAEGKVFRFPKDAGNLQDNLQISTLTDPVSLQSVYPVAGLYSAAAQSKMDSLSPADYDQYRFNARVTSPTPVLLIGAITSKGDKLGVSSTDHIDSLTRPLIPVKAWGVNLSQFDLISIHAMPALDDFNLEVPERDAGTLKVGGSAKLTYFASKKSSTNNANTDTKNLSIEGRIKAINGLNSAGEVRVVFTAQTKSAWGHSGYPIYHWSDAIRGTEPLSGMLSNMVLEVSAGEYQSNASLRQLVPVPGTGYSQYVDTPSPSPVPKSSFLVPLDSFAGGSNASSNQPLRVIWVLRDARLWPVQVEVLVYTDQHAYVREHLAIYGNAVPPAYWRALAAPEKGLLLKVGNRPFLEPGASIVLKPLPDWVANQAAKARI